MVQFSILVHVSYDFELKSSRGIRQEGKESRSVDGNPVENDQNVQHLIAVISINSPSRMLKSRSFVKKTKRGAVVKVVREHYLRDDVWTGWQGEKRVSCADPFVENVAARKSTLCPFKHLLVPDTNVVLHQVL